MSPQKSSRKWKAPSSRVETSNLVENPVGIVAATPPDENNDDKITNNPDFQQPPKRPRLQNVPTLELSSFVEPTNATKLRVQIRDENSCWACYEEVSLEIAHLLPKNRKWVCVPLEAFIFPSHLLAVLADLNCS